MIQISMLSIKSKSFQRSVVFLSLISFLTASETPNRVPKQPPHIIFILADDLGWNDVSFHGSPSIPTPNIDALAMNGVALQSHYAEYMCTPSRAALLTGKYPSRMGLQHFVQKCGEETALPLDEVTLPQHLKKLGYDTHLVGKWHLGYHTSAHTPTKRGFDTFLGYYTGYIDHYDYTHNGLTGLLETPTFYGIDLRNGTQLVKNFRGEYAGYVFADQAKNIILNHNSSRPLFLYFPQVLVHTGNNFQPFQAPPEKVSKFKYIDNLNRRVLAGMVSALDDTVGTVFSALHQKDMLSNSVLVFVSDNGGKTSTSGFGASSNHPLRGQKMTPWEGGVRVPALVWSPLMKLNESRVSKQLMHMSDWLPTLYSAAGGKPADLGNIDGSDLWEFLTKDLPSPRTTLLHNLDPVFGISAFRRGHLKVVNGTTEDRNGWYGPSGFENMDPPSSMFQHVFQNGSPVRDILVKEGWWIADDTDEWYEENRVRCVKPSQDQASQCDADVKPCLFNVTEDPCEYIDLADKYPEIVQEMMQEIKVYQDASLPPQSKPSDPNADPTCHGFAFVSWKDPEHLTTCDYMQRKPGITRIDKGVSGSTPYKSSCSTTILTDPTIGIILLNHYFLYFFSKVLN